MLRRATYKELIDPLISYTCEKMGETNLQKLGAITLTYEIIREAIADLHGDNLKYQKDAADYFNSELFLQHCQWVLIPEHLMLRIVLNPESYLQTMVYHQEEGLDYESDLELGNLS